VLAPKTHQDPASRHCRSGKPETRVAHALRDGKALMFFRSFRAETRKFPGGAASLQKRTAGSVELRMLSISSIARKKSANAATP